MGYKIKKDIDPHNDLGQYHGYQEWYFIDFWFRGCYKNGVEIGYQEEHRLNTNINDYDLKKTQFFIR